MLIAPLETGGAQTTASKAKKPPAPTGPSTLSGVYTAEQASRGKDVYMGSCKSCHSPESHTGATFAKWWRGKQLSELFAFVNT
jgi:cytochrome c5